LLRDSDQIDQSFDQLQRIDLLPYFNLMRVAEGSVRPWADAVLTTHARYRGFRGLRERTDPISVDREALNLLLELPPISQWRASGGLVVSGSLGDPLLRQFYEAAGDPVEQIALDAFLAGNDLLILNDFVSSSASNGEAANIRRTIDLFRQRYREDLDFQDRVDSAVKRILRLKYRLYPNFSPLDVMVDPNNVGNVLGSGLPELDALANDAVTRLFPGPAQLAEQELPVPGADDTFLILTDTRLIVDCEDECPARATLATDAISQTLIALGNVPPEQIASFSFADLKPFVLGVEDALDLNDAFAQADWIILGHQNLQPDIAQSDAARLLLRTRPDLLEGKNVVLFLFGPPYEWTADDLSRLTEAYVMYSIHPPFVEAAVRALLGESQPPGASPVNVPAIDYDLTRQTEPDPQQVIEVLLDIPPPPVDPLTPVPTGDTATPAPPVFRAEDTIRIRTGVILDHNGNAVPDGTPVQFQLAFRGLQETQSTQEAVTTNGWAAIDYTIPELGLLEVRVISEPAIESNTLRLTITETSTSIQTVAPPAVSPTPTATVTPTRVIPPTPTPTAAPFVDQIFDPTTRRVTVIDFVLALFGIALVSAWGYRGESKRDDENAIDRAVRLVLWGALAGLLAYTYYGLGLPGSDALRQTLGNWAALAVTLAGAALPWLIERVRRVMR
jgi:beta-N-acetylhexosaminidase